MSCCLRPLMYCMCQHRQIRLFSRILSFQRSFSPRNRFHLGELSLWAYTLDMQVNSLARLSSILLSGPNTDWNLAWSRVKTSPPTSRSVSQPVLSSGSRLETMNWPEWMDSLCLRTAITLLTAVAWCVSVPDQRKIASCVRDSRRWADPGPAGGHTTADVENWTLMCFVTRLQHPAVETFQTGQQNVAKLYTSPKS